MTATACSTIVLLLRMHAGHLLFACAVGRLHLRLTLVRVVRGLLLVMILVIVVSPLLAGVAWPSASALKSGGRLIVVVCHVTILILIDVLDSERLRVTLVSDSSLRTRVHGRLFRGYN